MRHLTRVHKHDVIDLLNAPVIISDFKKPQIFGCEIPSGVLISILWLLLVLAVVVCLLVLNLVRLHVYLIYNGWTTWDYYCRPLQERKLHSYWNYNYNYKVCANSLFILLYNNLHTYSVNASNFAQKVNID